MIYVSGSASDFAMDDGKSVTGSESSTPTDSETPRILSALTATLERLLLRNERCIGPLSFCQSSRLYYGVCPPRISIGRYLRRINRYTGCSSSCFVLGFAYIDQLVHRQPDFSLVWLNIHRLLLTSIMLATKFLDDLHHNNSFYAKVGGISVHELNVLEIDLLFKLNFQLHITPATYQGYNTHLERELLLAEKQQIGRALANLHLTSDFEQNQELNGTQDAHKSPYFLKQSPLPTVWITCDD